MQRGLADKETIYLEFALPETVWPPQDLLTTQSPIPAQTSVMPIHVSRVITLPSAHHSPNTVNRNARELVIGTVKLNSASN